MFEQPSGAAAVPEDSTPRDLLTRARAAQATVRQGEADLLRCVLQWAIVHPSDDGTTRAEDAAAFVDAAGVEPIAGDGCPGVAAFAVAELGSELGLPTPATKRLVGHALELAHRLPRTWRRVLGGEVDPWRARRVAEATIHAHPRLTPEAAAWVDAQIAPFIDRVGPAQLDRLVASAVERFHLADTVPGEDHEDAAEQVDTALHVTFGDVGPDPSATVELAATLTLADGLDLQHALQSGAAELKGLGSTASLDARRARALGHLARLQTSLDLTGGAASGLPPEDGLGPVGPTRAPQAAARRLDLHLHFSVSPDGVAPLGLLENGQRLVRREHLKQWLGDSLTEVRVLPVLDLATEISSTRYVPPSLLRRQVQLRDTTCVFPWCSRPARSCDLDHIVPYDHSRAAADGPPQTRTTNLATLCRFHHRLKTHASWRLHSPTNGVFVWTSPHGHRYHRDPSGTARLDDP